MFKVYDYQCINCKHVYRDQLTPCDENNQAPEIAALTCIQEIDQYDDPQRGSVVCGGELHRLIGAPLGITIVKGNSDFNERETARLEKRSLDHFASKGHDEARYREEAIKKRMGWIGQ